MDRAAPTYRPSECGRFVCETVEHLSVVRLHSLADAEAIQATHDQHWGELTRMGDRPRAADHFRKASELKRACAFVRGLNQARAA